MKPESDKEIVEPSGIRTEFHSKFYPPFSLLKYIIATFLKGPFPECSVSFLRNWCLLPSLIPSEVQLCLGQTLSLAVNKIGLTSDSVQSMPTAVARGPGAPDDPGLQFYLMADYYPE